MPIKQTQYKNTNNILARFTKNLKRQSIFDFLLK